MNPLELRISQLEAEVAELKSLLHIKPSKYMSKRNAESLKIRKQILFGGKKK